MANIQPQDQRINTNLQIVDYTPSTNATMQTGAFRAQQEIAANTRKINRANQAMKEFKAKQEQKALSNEAVAYIQRLGQSKDPVTQDVMKSIAVNTEDPAEIKNFIKTQGGPTAAMKLINDSADSIRNFRQDMVLEATKQAAKSASASPEATYIKAEDVKEFEATNNVTITKLDPVQDSEGNTIFEIKGTKPKEEDRRIKN